ncbi:MAG: ribosomal RNA small subunit methyltransferase A [Spirochaetes bacterium]|nr:ribosomal RNA small subunit methyltransferase A [Spirochaetota bacterium]
MKEKEDGRLKPLCDIITSPVQLRHFLKDHSLALKKSLGQNFLHDRNIILKIIKIMDLRENDHLVEVGPGIGTMPVFYLPLIQSALLIEIDKGLCSLLEKYIDLPRVNLLHANFLKIDLGPYLEKKIQYKFFSNLPYNIASQIIVKLIDYTSSFHTMFIMVPDVLYRRIIAIPGSKDYSRFTIMVSSFFRVTRLFSVKKGSFFPVPQVDSLFLKLTPLSPSLIPHDQKDVLKDFLQILFHARRKKINSALLQLSQRFKMPEEKIVSFIRASQIDPSHRIEQIPLHKIIFLFKEISFLTS